MVSDQAVRFPLDSVVLVVVLQDRPAQEPQAPTLSALSVASVVAPQGRLVQAQLAPTHLAPWVDLELAPRERLALAQLAQLERTPSAPLVNSVVVPLVPLAQQVQEQLAQTPSPPSVVVQQAQPAQLEQILSPHSAVGSLVRQERRAQQVRPEQQAPLLVPIPWQLWEAVSRREKLLTTFSFRRYLSVSLSAYLSVCR